LIGTIGKQVWWRHRSHAFGGPLGDGAGDTCIVRPWIGFLTVGAEPLGCGASRLASAIDIAAAVMAVALACLPVFFIGNGSFGE
jgi:hypothetical protein